MPSTCLAFDGVPDSRTSRDNTDAIDELRRALARWAGLSPGATTEQIEFVGGKVADLGSGNFVRSRF